MSVVDTDLTRTWYGALSLWVHWLKASGKPATTIGLREYQLRRFARDHFDRSPWDIDLDALAAWLGSFDWAIETRRSYRASLRHFYNWAHITGRIPTNPAAQLPAITPPRGKPRPAPEDVYKRGLASAGERERLMLRLAANAGLRRGEIAVVHTHDLVATLMGWDLRVHGKGGKTRLVPLLDDLARELRRYPPGYIFPGQIDGHLSPRRVGELISELLDEHWTAHTLRHRFAGLAYQVERDIRAVQELLGHASVVTTQIYTPVPTDALRNAVRAAA